MENIVLIDWMPEDGMLVLQSDDIPVRTKPRPRAGKWGIHMPREYQEWKKTIRHHIDMALVERFSNRQTLFGSDPVALWLLVAASRGDADNAAGGLMDAFTGCVWDDDRQVMELHIWKIPKKTLECHWKARIIRKTSLITGFNR